MADEIIKVLDYIFNSEVVRGIAAGVAIGSLIAVSVAVVIFVKIYRQHKSGAKR